MHFSSIGKTMMTMINYFNMKKEFGKWLMDIAKYIATAVILSSVFGAVDTWIMYIVGSIAVVLILLCGLMLVTEKPLTFRILNKKK